MKDKGARVAVAVLIIIFILLPVGFFVLLMAAFGGESDFYHPTVITLFLAVSVWMIAYALQAWQKKKMWFLFLGIMLSGTIAIGIHEGQKSYIKNIPVVGDQGVDLFEYKPFTKDSKIARLNEKATFRMQGELLSIDGATALYPLYAAFAEAVYPEDDYDPYRSNVMSNTTPDAYRRLLSGEADLIFCAAPSRSQVADAKADSIEFNMTAIGKEAFVFFVNTENPVSELTVEQIQDIYSGKITNWKDVGGKDEEIKAFQRPKNSGSQTMLEKIMEDKPLMNPPLNNRVGGMGEIIDRTAQYKNFANAIGYTFLFFATEMIGNNQIKLIKVNGIEANRKTIETGTYPFTGDFYAITTDSKNENITGFIDWILSPQGQLLVEKTGYTPLKTDN